MNNYRDVSSKKVSYLVNAFHIVVKETISDIFMNYFWEEDPILPNDQNFFTFELNESLHFEKGHEVGEMLNISLDPEISIESFNDYISIRGAVELGGEYEKVDLEESRINELDDLDNRSIYRYMERIENAGEGRAIFSHRFPVEISIPSNRVPNMSDIAVSIDSFDYEIPSENQLKLTSIIKIAGIRKQTNEFNEDLQNNKESSEEELFDQRFELDIKQENDQKEETEETPLETMQQTQRKEDKEVSQQLLPEDSQEDEEKEKEKDRWMLEKTQTFDEFFEKPKVTETETNEKQKVDEEITEVPEETLETSEEEETIEEEVIELGEEINYLSDMFRADDEEGDRQFSQVRICIVQEKDTIETIAERYNIAESKIMKTNMLDDDELEEGQLLSIPREVIK